MKNKMLSSLGMIIQDVNEAPGLEQALDITVRHIRQVMGVDAASVYYRDVKNEQLTLMATDGLNPGAIGKIKFNVDQGLVGLVFNLAEPLNIKDAHKHPNYRFVTETGEVSFHGFLGVPIIQHRYVHGVLVVRQTSSRRFSASDEAFLVTLAAQLAGAISHAEKMGELNHLLEDGNNNSLILDGLSGSPGIAIGQALIVFPDANLDAVPDISIAEDEIEQQIAVFNEAVNNVDNEFKELSQRMQGIVSSQELALFDVYGLILKSDELIESVIMRIKNGQWAQGALRQTINEHIRQFAAMDDVYLRERALDIKDIGLRLLVHLQSRKTSYQQVTGQVSEQVVLVGEEITVSQFSEVPVKNLVAIISAKGSASSHVAIIARALGIPSIMGVDDLPVNHIQAQQIIVDGNSGQLIVNPSEVVLEEYQRLIHEEKLLDSRLEKLIDKPSETIDGMHVPLYVNTGLLQDISPSLQCGAEGVGLYRTEIPFLMSKGFPGEDRQANIYRYVLQSFSPLPVTFRTLDIGGDKALPYFPVVEANPFLGWRGIRIMLDHPEIFLTQIRAILKANIYQNNLRLMLPMVSDLSEVDEALGLIKKAHKELQDEGINNPFPEIGLMIEVPSAVYQMRTFVKRVDFFSVGSNDLTQYLLAVDRNNKRVADLYNCMHPSVLASIKHIVDIAHNSNKPVSVCGEMAGDPASALALVGIGVDILSMSAANLLKVKSAIRSFTHKELQQLSTKALELEDTSSIRSLFDGALEGRGNLAVH